MPQPSINNYKYTKSVYRILSYFVTYLYFITQYIKITYTNQNITIRVIKTMIKVKKEGKIMFKKVNENIESKEWKEKDQNYLRELQSFLDKADNIEDNNLKQLIIGQMLRCDDVLTKIAQSRFKEIYKLGYKKAKEE